MNIEDLQGKLVAVLGYGQEGKAVTGYLMNHGVSPTLFDQKSWHDWPEDEKEKIKSLNLNFIFGPGYLDELRGFDVAFRSPGVPLSKIRNKEGLRSLYVTSQTKWFFEHCPARIIGVTGTKGKGTTASLIFEILKKQWQVYLTGNIGKVQPLEILDALKQDDWVVYELSSFQLQDLDRSPHVAVVLMVTSEHLDYHLDQGEYVAAKSAIAKYQSPDDFSIINADFGSSVKVGGLGKGKKFYFSTKKILEEGCFVSEGKIILKIANRVRLAFPVSRLQLRGEHNLENVCAAVLAAHFAGSNDEATTEVVTGFKGLEHRLEFVAEKNGIKFYNDSFSTTPETTIAAIKSFSEPEIVILGGSTKNSSFSGLGKTISSSANIKSLILIGQESINIKKAILARGKFKNKIFEGAKTMREIFSQVTEIAQPGDVVLLSPACASFGMFTNYIDRGLQFKEFVSRL